MLALRALFLAAATATAGHVCPYAYRSFSTTYCSNMSSTLCIVDGNCKVVQAWSAAGLAATGGYITDAATDLQEIPDIPVITFSGNGLKSIGDLSKMTNGSAISICRFIQYNPGVQLNKMVLPASLTTLGLPYNAISTLPPTIQWPTGLRTM
uniref:Secreted protein n=1 Tax=Achlya hypogyna TaxID=1202772 RepID=A0A0A7CMY6_ACHHY|nr:secreted protein [Achlya hypogyna]